MALRVLMIIAASLSRCRFPFPDVDGRHAGEDVDTGGQAPVDQRAARPARPRRRTGRSNRSERACRFPATERASTMYEGGVPSRRRSLPEMASLAQKFEKIAFVASDVPEARLRLRAPGRDLWQRRAGDGRRHRRARRRRPDAADAAPPPQRPSPDLRHEPRLRRLPHERLPRGRPARPPRTRAEISVIHPLSMRAVDRQGKVHTALAINEVSLFRADLPGGQAARSPSTARCGWRN